MDHPQKGRNNHTAMRALALCLLAGWMFSAGRAGMLDHMSSQRTMLKNVGRSAICDHAAPAFPEADISNDLIHIRLYLPDPKDGYYRGSRFDWSGVMPALSYQNHTWCGQWFEKYAPTTHDAIMGPVESFSPLGFEQAVPVDNGKGGIQQGHFVAVGIGVLARDNQASYSPFHYYEVVNPGKWAIERKTDRISFTQTISDTSYAYEYTKTLFLPKGKMELRLMHQLKNTGHKVMEMSVYDHNLFVIDSQPTGPGTFLSFPFSLTATEARGIGTLAEIRGKRLVFLQTPAKKQDVYTVLEGYGRGRRDYDIRIGNARTRAVVRITCDKPLSKLVCWASKTVACPEPYIQLKVNPGETVFWNIKYQFYTLKENIHE